jgi:hypothetical protein
LHDLAVKAIRPLSHVCYVTSDCNVFQVIESYLYISRPVCRTTESFAQLIEMLTHTVSGQTHLTGAHKKEHSFALDSVDDDNDDVQRVLHVMDQAKEWVAGKPEYFKGMTKFKKTPGQSREAAQAKAQQHVAGAHTPRAHSQATDFAYPQGAPALSVPQAISVMPPYVVMPVMMPAWVQQPAQPGMQPLVKKV